MIVYRANGIYTILASGSYIIFRGSYCCTFFSLVGRSFGSQPGYRRHRKEVSVNRHSTSVVRNVECSTVSSWINWHFEYIKYFSCDCSSKTDGRVELILSNLRLIRPLNYWYKYAQVQKVTPKALLEPFVWVNRTRVIHSSRNIEKKMNLQWIVNLRSYHNSDLLTLQESKAEICTIRMRILVRGAWRRLDSNLLQEHNIIIMPQAAQSVRFACE